MFCSNTDKMLSLSPKRYFWRESLFPGECQLYFNFKNFFHFTCLLLEIKESLEECFVYFLLRIFDDLNIV